MMGLSISVEEKVGNHYFSFFKNNILINGFEYKLKRKRIKVQESKKKKIEKNLR